jgi:hypothetical protein
MIDNFNINIKKLTCVGRLFNRDSASRFISPQTIIDGNQIYLAWLPLSVMYSVIFIFGRYAIAPLIIAFAITNHIILLTATGGAAILPAVLGVGVLRDCQNADGRALAQWADGKTYGDADFLGRFFCAGVNETHHVSGGRFCVSVGYLQLFQSMPLFIPLLIYKA